MNDDEYSRLIRASVEAAFDRIERGEPPKPPTKQEALEDTEKVCDMAKEFSRAVFQQNAGKWVAELNGPPNYVSFPMIWIPLVRRYREQLLAVADHRLTREKFQALVIGDAKEKFDSKLASCRQATIASRPREDALQEIILEVLKDRPDAGEQGVIRELEKRKRNGVIEDIIDGEVEWTDKEGGAKNTPIPALKQRISRARKKLSEAD